MSSQEWHEFVGTQPYRCRPGTTRRKLASLALFLARRGFESEKFSNCVPRAFKTTESMSPFHGVLLQSIGRFAPTMSPGRSSRSASGSEGWSAWCRVGCRR